jgi:hypothetical protein
VIPWIIQSFRGGISDESTKGILGAFKFGYDLDIHKRRDSLSCNWATATITGATCSSLIQTVVSGADGSAYCFSNDGSIYAIAGNPLDPVFSYLDTDDNGAIKGSAEWSLSDGTRYLYWATATSLARKLMPGDDAWADKTQDHKVELFQSSDWHPIKNATGSLCVGNKDFVATLSYAGVWNPIAMNLRPGNLIKCFEERDDYLIIGSERLDDSEEGYIWNWISTAQNWVQKKKIPVKGVNALIDTEKLLLQGGTEGEMFYSDFTNTAPLNSCPDGGTCNPGGVSIENDLAMFGIFGGTDNPGLYSYGRRMMNRPSAFNLEHRMAKTVAGSTVSEIGAVWNNNNTIFASYKTYDGSTLTYGVDMVSSTTRATARYESLEFNGGSPHLKKSFDTAKIVMEPLPSGCSVQFIYKKDRGSWTNAKLPDGSTSYSVIGGTEAEFVLNTKAKVMEVGVIMTPSGSSTPEVTAIITYIGPTDEH